MFVRVWSLRVITIAGAMATTVAVGGCDGSESRPACELLEDATHTFSTVFQDQDAVVVARFEFQQAIRTYDDTGDCELPGRDINETRVIVTNLTSCTLDISFSLSVFEGRDGWTELGTSSVRANAAEDLGIVHSQSGGIPRVDVGQVILTGTVVRSECT